jgi:transcriptional regulator GlxA family with amidase domain
MRRVVIVAFPGVQTLDVTGPAEVLRAATKIHPPGYDVTVVAPEAGPLRTSTVTMLPDLPLSACRFPIDTLIVAGGTGTRRAEEDDQLIEWLKGAARRSRGSRPSAPGPSCSPGPACSTAVAPPRTGRRARISRSAIRRDHAPGLPPAGRSEPSGLQIEIQEAGRMRIAIPLYDRFTALDAVGPYEVLSRLPGASVTWLAHEPGVVRTDNTMLGIEADAAFEDLSDPEIVMVPGGTGTNAFLEDERLVGWIRRAHETSQWTTSVCTGSLLLGAAGVLDGLEATSHWLVLPELERFGARPTGRRVVEQGKVVTAAGVSSGIDMGLALAARIAGEEVAQAIQLAIEYDPQPPFDAGSTEKAPAEIVELVRGLAAARR